MSTDQHRCDGVKELMVKVCHLLAERNFTTATGGNVSVRVEDGSFWVTPGRLHKARVTEADLVRIDGCGKKLEGARNPSSEALMHLAVYRALPRAGAVVHAHPPAATGYAQAGKAIDTGCSSEAVAILGPQVPLIRYERPSTDALAQAVADSMHPGQKAYLMANHGVLTWGADLWEAYDMLDTLEIFAQSLVVATLVGGPKELPRAEREWLVNKFRS